ncbi:Uncharacterised protein [uncultured archaeon]|nr:Uncharacterised protein [uncultured archaeon]
MKKGFFFTIDSILGIAVIIILLATAISLNLASQKSGDEMAIMHASAADSAETGYLKGEVSSAPDNSSKISAACAEIFQYSNGDTVAPRVVKCTTLG